MKMKMKMKMNNNMFVFIWSAIVLFASCTKEKSQPVGSDYQFKRPDSTNVTAENAQSVALSFVETKGFLDAASSLKSSVDYKVKDYTIVPDENDEPAMYIINFDPVGFIIISATSKEIPILAFSDSASFDTENISS